MSRIQHVFGKALVGIALALSVALPLGAAERRADILYNFTGGADGAFPGAGLIRDTAGNFYGVAPGGNGLCCGAGVVFKLSPLGAETPIYTFTGGRDGAEPFGKLVADAAGNLYGTTEGGGDHNLGVVFKLTPGGMETVLYSFAGESDGARPGAGLAMDAAGNLYGTTSFGDLHNAGIIFKIAPDGTETVLHAFTDRRDGSGPQSDLIMGRRGALYGTAFLGGASNSGTVFKIPPDGKFSVLYSFTGLADGGRPAGGVIMDRHGALYGTTTSGGGGPCNTCGVVFKLAPDGTETVLHNFAGAPDAASPSSSLVLDRHGNLFGVTYLGGRSNRGAVFQISPDGTETVLHSFSRPPDGERPSGSLLLYMNKLFGTTAAGGAGAACAPQPSCGTVFEVRKAK
jgi:uncharacterized repeat protein (TIGR03803 family)